jgi:membrane protein implicated in regulation of membrane protease activity
VPDPLRLAAFAAEIGMNYAGRRQLRRDAAEVLGDVLLLSLAGILAATGTGFLLAAIWYGLVPLVGHTGAALLVAGILFLGALIAVIASRLSNRAKRKAPPPPDQLELVVGEVTKLVQKYKGSLLLAALLAGILASERRTDLRVR